MGFEPCQPQRPAADHVGDRLEAPWAELEGRPKPITEGKPDETADLTNQRAFEPSTSARLLPPSAFIIHNDDSRLSLSLPIRPRV